MPKHPDALDKQLRALTRRAFDDAILVRQQRGRLVTRRWRLGPGWAALALAALVAIVAVVMPLRFHQGNRSQAPATHDTQRTGPNALPTAGPLPGPAQLNSLDSLEGAAVNAAGDLYLGEGYDRRVVMVTRDGVPILFAGPAPPGATPKEGGPAANGIFGEVRDVAVDNSGNVYVLDAQLGVRRITPDGSISTLARVNGSPAFAPVPAEGGSIAVTDSGTVYVACGDCHPPGSSGISNVYAITADGSVRVVAGGDRPVIGAAAAGVVQGAAGSTLLASPIGIATDARGDVFIADWGNNRIREIAVDGHVSTVAGSDSGVAGFSGDGGSATQAELNHPGRIAVDAAGNLFVVDVDNHRIREVTAGIIQTVAGPRLDGSTATPPPSVSVAPGKLFFGALWPNHTRTIASPGLSIAFFEEGP